MKRFAAIKPPTIKHIVAISEGICKLANPVMECPDVQPPAYRVPKPTRKPPATVNRSPCRENRFAQLKISTGIIPEKSVIPCRWSCAMRSTSSCPAGLLLNQADVIIAPTNIPATNSKFQRSLFQLYWKNRIPEGNKAAQNA